jgi:hypothetical protein
MQRVLGRQLRRQEIVDHINFDGTDNRRENLRLVSFKQSTEHRRHTFNQSNPFRGVRLRESGNYESLVTHNYKQINCGTYKTAEMANLAAMAKRKELGFISDTKTT